MAIILLDELVPIGAPVFELPKERCFHSTFLSEVPKRGLQSAPIVERLYGHAVTPLMLRLKKTLAGFVTGVLKTQS